MSPDLEKSIEYIENDEYSIGWICALNDPELEASILMYDEEFRAPMSHDPVQDNTRYHGGRIHGHNVVMACIPESLTYGEASAAATVTNMRHSFKNLAAILLVGIGGGMPECNGDSKDIRLGDVVVSMNSGRHPAVAQYDFGKIHEEDFEPTKIITEIKPMLRAASQSLQRRPVETHKKLKTVIDSRLLEDGDFKSEAAEAFARPDLSTDKLQDPKAVASCNHDKKELCDNCTIPRPSRKDPDSPLVHYGPIATGNSVIKDAAKRDFIRNRDKTKCCEMEAAGASVQEGCLIIRGICDYSDATKAKEWQPYAAITAAAYARVLLEKLVVSPPFRPPTAVTIYCHGCDTPRFRAGPRYKCPICPSSNRCERCLTDLRQMAVDGCTCHLQLIATDPDVPNAIALQKAFFIKIEKTMHCPALAQGDKSRRQCNECTEEAKDIIYRCRAKECEKKFQFCSKCIRTETAHFVLRNSGHAHSFWAYTLRDDENTPGWDGGNKDSEYAKLIYKPEFERRKADAERRKAELEAAAAQAKKSKRRGWWGLW